MRVMRERRMRRVLIGIDSSDALSYSIVVAGPEEDLESFYESMLEILNKVDVKRIHFRKIEKRRIDRVSKDIAKLINESRTISFRIFQHKRPMGESQKRYYLDYIPGKIADYLKSFDNTNRLIQIFVHDDYRVPGVIDSTCVFIDNLIRKTSRRMSREDIGIKILKDGRFGFESTKITTKEGNYIKIRGICTNQENSKAITIADMVLGFYKRYKKMVGIKVKCERI